MPAILAGVDHLVHIVIDRIVHNMITCAHMKIKLGAVWHFSIAVNDPEKSAHFWSENFELHEMFRSDEAVALTNGAVIVGFVKGTPHPETIDHLAFHLESPRTLHDALETLKSNGVDVEDPGNEIGPVAPGSPNLGLWFHDPDGYRWELSVERAAPSAA